MTAKCCICHRVISEGAGKGIINTLCNRCGRFLELYILQKLRNDDE